MKSKFLISIVLLLMIFVSCKHESPIVDEGEKVNLNFNPYELYAVNETKYKNSDTRSFRIFSNIDDFFSVFERIIKEGPDILPKVFEDSLAIAVIMPKILVGKNYLEVNIKYKEVYLNNETLNVKYSIVDSIDHQLGFFSFALATIQRQNFNKVKFYQNDTLVKAMNYPSRRDQKMFR